MKPQLTEHQLSVFDNLEAYYLEKFEHAKDDDLLKAVWKSYKKSTFPMLVCKECGEDPDCLISAVEEITVLKGQPKACRLHHALCLLRKTELDSQQANTAMLDNVMAVAYGAFQEGENISTVSLPPVEILKSVGLNLSTGEFYATYRYAVEQYGETFMEVCRERYTAMSSNDKATLSEAIRNNTYATEKREKTEDVAKTGGKIIARVGIVALAHTYGNIVAAVAAIWALVALLLGVFYWFSGVWLAALACAFVVVCACVVAFQILVASGSNLKLLVICFYAGCFVSGCVLWYLIISIILGSISLVKEVI